MCFMHSNLALLETWARVHIAAFLDEHLGSLSEESATSVTHTTSQQCCLLRYYSMKLRHASQLRTVPVGNVCTV